MLILLLVLCIIGYFYIKNDYIFFLLTFFNFVAVLGLILCTISLSQGFAIAGKIEMYQEENQNIEKEINIIVENYKYYEQSTFMSSKNESPITLVNLFPELKTNELIGRQIEVYIENSNKIKELKEKKIDLAVYKWWLYFGK